MYIRAYVRNFVKTRPELRAYKTGHIDPLRAKKATAQVLALVACFVRSVLFLLTRVAHVRSFVSQVPFPINPPASIKITLILGKTVPNFPTPELLKKSQRDCAHITLRARRRGTKHFRFGPKNRTSVVRSRGHMHTLMDMPRTKAQAACLS